MADKELFGISEPLDCSDCVNHGGDWDCDHVHCRKGTDTISRQAALDALGDEPEVWTGKDEYAQGLNNQWHYDRNAIKALPTVDAVPVRHGRWETDGMMMDDGEYLMTRCTACGEAYEYGYNMPYCPCCGALMDGKGGNGNGL